MKKINQLAILFAVVILVSPFLYAQPAPLSVTVAGSLVSCNGTNNGSAFAIVKGGTSPYSYLWSNGGIASSISGLAPGSYSVKVTDAASTTATASYTILQPNPLNVSLDYTEIKCNGGADGSISPLVFGGTATKVIVNSPYDVAFNAARANFGPANYNVTANVVYIQDNSGTFFGCNPYPPGSLAGKIAIIDRGAAPCNFAFVSKVQNAQDAGAVGVIIPNAATAQGFIMTGTSTTITIPSVMISSLDAAPIKALLANSTSVNATLQSGFQYSWSNGATSPTLTGLSNGTYNLTVTDVQGCSATRSTVLSNPPTISITTSGTNLTCNSSNDGSAEANATGGNLNCLISNTGPRTTGSFGRLFGALGTNLLVTGQNFVACNTGFLTAIKVFLGGNGGLQRPVLYNVPLRVAAGNTTSATSYSEMVTVPSENGYWLINLAVPFPVVSGNTYSFSLGGAGSTGPVFLPPPAGLNGAAITYSTGNYPNGNVFTETGAQNVNDDLVFDVKIAGTANFPYAYSWNNGATTPSISGLAAGTYTVTATDAKGCTKSASITLTEPDPLTIDAGPNRIVYKGYPDSSCTRLQSSGAAGGTPPFTLTWSNGSHESFIDVCPTETTVYTLNITDAHNCSYTTSVKVCVLDVRCGNKLDKVSICHATGSASNPFVTLCVDINGAKGHFQNHAGDQLGACGMAKECNFPTAAGQRMITSNVKETQEKVELLAAWPNPFSHTTSIRFMTGENDYVNLKVIDIAGREIIKLYSGATKAGIINTVSFDASRFNSGIYLLIMNTKRGVNHTKKLMLNN